MNNVPAAEFTVNNGKLYVLASDVAGWLLEEGCGDQAISLFYTALEAKERFEEMAGND